MRNLFWQISVTLDGLMEGPNRELDDTAQFVDRDFDRYATTTWSSGIVALHYRGAEEG